MEMERRRQSIRYQGYDYRQGGGYFVTVCTYRKQCVFGDVINGAMRLNRFGKIAYNCWQEITDHFPHVMIDTFIVMPNHVHGVLLIGDSSLSSEPVGVCHGKPFEEQRRTQHFEARYASPLNGSLGTVIGAYKSSVTRRINELRGRRTTVWQRNYYERIIRDEKELVDTCRYIIENPSNWHSDEEHPNRAVLRQD